MEERLDRLNELGCWDWAIRSFDGSCLTLVGGSPLSPGGAHSVEVTFEDVSYLDCAVEFSHARFRRAAPEEVGRVAERVPVEADDVVVVIEAETMAGLEPRRFQVVAGAVAVTETEA